MLRKCTSVRLSISRAGSIRAAGLGAEVAKNLVLAGVGSLDVHDATLTTHADLSSSFLLGEAEVGQPRGSHADERLAPLNPYVRVRGLTDGPFDSSAALDGYTTVVAVDRPMSELIRISTACREAGCKLVVCDARGVFGRVFCDFGDTFVVGDVDGEPVKSALIEHIATSADGEAATVSEQPHGLEDGDTVRFEEVDGMAPLCADDRTFTVRVTSRHGLQIGDTRAMGEYVGGGRLVQVKQPTTLSFEPLEKAVGAPRILETGLDSPRRLRTVHACFGAAEDTLYEDGTRAQRQARLRKAVASSGLFGEGKLAAVDSIVDDFAAGHHGRLSPLAAFLGGVAAQEVIKACTGRYTPLHQFLYFDGTAVLPEPRPTPEECAPRADRYDGTRAVLGERLVARLGALTYFVVGAGAIGCELLKCLALMGVGCDASGGGAVHVTDMDTIEKSNLNRQFLFRPSDVGKAKSRCAAAAVAAINPNMNIIAYEEKVGDESSTFVEPFWTSLDGVANALDNVQARLYVDQCCVAHKLPLLESGTSGTKGNTQTVLPLFTESYGSSADPPEKTIPVCTLKSFPYQIEHTLQWARDVFEGEFAQAAESINQWLERDDYLSALGRDAPDELVAAVESVHSAILERPSESTDASAWCVRWALAKFDRWYVSSIRALCSQFPPGHKSESGDPFWGGTRRRPTPSPFDVHDEGHVGFVISAARLRARSLGVGDPTDAEILEALATASSADTLGDGAASDDPVEAVAGSEEEAKKQKAAGLSASTQRRVEKLMGALDSTAARAARTGDAAAAWRAHPESFEKDDDANGHMAFITAASNLRARNYAIPTVDVHQSKLIAGRIVPAIATTTACVVGLVGLDLLKLAEGRADDDPSRYCHPHTHLPPHPLVPHRAGPTAPTPSRPPHPLVPHRAAPTAPTPSRSRLMTVPELA